METAHGIEYTAEKQTLAESLQAAQACWDASRWALDQDTTDPQVLWERCENPHWLVYLLVRRYRRRTSDLRHMEYRRHLDMLLRVIADHPGTVDTHLVKVVQWLRRHHSDRPPTEHADFLDSILTTMYIEDDDQDETLNLHVCQAIRNITTDRGWLPGALIDVAGIMRASLSVYPYMCKLIREYYPNVPTVAEVEGDTRV